MKVALIGLGRMGRNHLRVLRETPGFEVVAVVDPHATWYDFEAKYLLAESRMAIPAPIPDAAAARVQSLACAAFDAIGCEGLARVDFFYTRDGRVVFNEINTMPGFTPASAFPKMWQASGIDYPALVDRLIQTALRRPTGLR